MRVPEGVDRDNFTWIRVSSRGSSAGIAIDSLNNAVTRPGLLSKRKYERAQVQAQAQARHRPGTWGGEWTYELVPLI